MHRSLYTQKPTTQDHVIGSDPRKLDCSYTPSVSSSGLLSIGRPSAISEELGDKPGMARNSGRKRRRWWKEGAMTDDPVAAAARAQQAILPCSTARG